MCDTSSTHFDSSIGGCGGVCAPKFRFLKPSEQSAHIREGISIITLQASSGSIHARVVQVSNENRRARFSSPGWHDTTHQVLILIVDMIRKRPFDSDTSSDTDVLSENKRLKLATSSVPGRWISRP